MCNIFVFFFKQKTAYEMRISDWSSDVCSSDLLTWTGISIHGSRRIADDIATHGCIGLPHGFAKILFDNARLGDTVMVTNNWSGNDDAIRMAEAAQPTPQAAPVLDYSFPIDTPADDAAVLASS